jgi:hypothetical protein
MIALTKIRELDLAAAAAPGRPLHLSAASGLVCIQSYMYMVADDEHHLGVFHRAPNEPGWLSRLFEGELPESRPDRKKHKPDFEALALLPAHGDFPHGALLALGSGSRSNRRLGALLGLDPLGAVRGPPRVVDLSHILVPLGDAFPTLNIEGAVVTAGELLLFQRGSKRNSDNAIIQYPLPLLLEALTSEQSGAIKPSAVIRIDLGQIDGVPFCFTDAAALPDGRTVFTAIAENTDNAYDDGPCLAAAVGTTDKEGHLLWMRRLDRPHKVEGVDARVKDDAIMLKLVTDADDPAIPACLFSATIRG